MPNKCSDCVFWWDQGEQNAFLGKCTRFPPHPLQSNPAFYPLTHKECYACGEFKSKVQTQTNERKKKK